MLVLHRKPEEEIVITLEDGRRITIAIIDIRGGNRVGVGISADRSIKVNRAEIQRIIDSEQNGNNTIATYVKERGGK